MRQGGTERIHRRMQKGRYHSRTTRHHDQGQKVADEPFWVAQIPPARRALPRLFLLPVRRTGEKPGAGNAEKRAWVEYERSRPATRAISSGTTTEAVTRPASGRVDISSVRLRAGSRLSVHQRESYCGYALRHLCCIWMADPAAAAAA